MDIRNIINESIDKAFQELKENKDNYKINQDIINSSNLLLIIRNKKNDKYWGSKFLIGDFSKKGFIKAVDRLIKEAIEELRA